MLATLRDQPYPDWRIILIFRDAASVSPALQARLLDGFGELAGHVMVLPGTETRSLSELLDECAKPHQPAFLGTLGAGDELGIDAMLELAIASGMKRGSDFFYADNVGLHRIEGYVSRF